MEILAWPDVPDLLALKTARPDRYPALLRTGGGGGWDILFAFPQADMRLSREAGRDEIVAFFDSLPQPAISQAQSSLPFRGGWLLALGYELGGLLEPAAGMAEDEENFPLAWACRIPAAILIDHAAGQTWLMAEADHHALLKSMQADLRAVPDAKEAGLPDMRLEEEPAGRFLDGVSRIKSYIREGDVFQVNLSRGWRAEFAAPVASSQLFCRLGRSNPAPFSAVADMSGWSIVSSSPERLVRLERGGRILTRPIAGTHPRGATHAEDVALKARLAAHPKERAEHIMLVDLERNDLGRVCEPGSVRVEALMELASYAHVHHLESSVVGQIRAGISLLELLRAVFPGGTITGCPKVRTMQIIRELENAPRQAYTGSLGYVNRDGTLDLNILIRSFLLKGQVAWFRTGAGIVADSEPERELAETRAKAKGLLKALMRSET
ncbi:MAG: aminodeoxychorismate synthase component I [Pseudomonadota bacterium]